MSQPYYMEEKESSLRGSNGDNNSLTGDYENLLDRRDNFGTATMFPRSFYGDNEYKQNENYDSSYEWYRNGVDAKKVENYIQSAASARLSRNTRSSHNRILGVTNLLRPVAQVPVTNSCPWFNNSSLRPSTECCLDGGPFNTF